MWGGVTLGPVLKVDTGMSKAGSAREGGARAGLDWHPLVDVRTED